MPNRSLRLFCCLLALFLWGCSRRPSAPPLRPAKRIDGILFEEAAERAGVRFQWVKQPRPLRNLEAFGCGCAFLDYDDDGWQDILLVAPPYPRLFHNRRNGTFEETSAQTGMNRLNGDWKGCGVGDYDGDGRLDLVVIGYHCLALLKNEAGLRFHDQTLAAGLDPKNGGHWGGGVGFMDLAGEGRLDLVLLNYVIMGPNEPQYCELRSGVKSGCPPDKYRPEFAEMWKNVGGRFVNVTETSGIKATGGKALVVAFADVNGDGRMDFYMGNDGTPAELMINRGKMRFENFGVTSRLSYNLRGYAPAAMGADWGDYDRDGNLDLIISDFAKSSYTLYRAEGNGLFAAMSDATGLSEPTYKPLGFGAKWLDFDNDGWLDIVFVNGHVYDNASDVDTELSFRQPTMLFRNHRGRSFEDLAPKMGGAAALPILGRGLATADFDNDGRVDFLAVDYEGKALLFRNLSETSNHWVGFDVRGGGANRFAYGAQVVATAGKEVWVGVVSPASSYLSSSDPRIHFGLGDVKRLDKVWVHWANGRETLLKNVRVDRMVRIEEPAP